MKKYIILTLMAVFLIPGMLFSDIVTFRVGYFIPRAQSDLWQIEFENMDFTKTDFQHSSFCFSYEYFFTRYSSLLISIEGYNEQKVGFYKDYVGYQFFDGNWAYPNEYSGVYNEEFIPNHVFSVSSTPILVSIKLLPLGRAQKIIPYIGAGGGIFLWSVQLEGDTIDFADEWVDTDLGAEVYPIYYTNAYERGRITFGAHAFGGLMVPVANRLSMEAEFKYNYVEGQFSDDEYRGFQGFEAFDLSGYQISIGINYWF
ncbi:MAG: hypothetical protein GF421_09125 [Candidatus Aminicenantes bacterium]|nr:hypothetical protein [Candidatus Aminicenantes bacterium]